MARGNGARSRNTRLAAVRSFFRYVAMNEPEWLLHCQRILALPDKRYVKRSVTFLDGPEIAALLAAPDRSTWTVRREIGRESCRERVCQYVEISVVAGTFKKKRT